MRRNENGIPHLKRKTFGSGRNLYFWNPPAYARKTGLFHFTTLGDDFQVARKQAKKLNSQIEPYLPAYRRIVVLERAEANSAAWLARSFEASPKYAKYSARTRKDYSRLFRRLEVFVCDGGELFGNLKVVSVTKHLAHSIYEHHSTRSGFGTANKMATAWQAAFKYGTHRIPELTSNPFSQLGREMPPARRQRWTNVQLSSFIKMANRLGYQSIGLCALMCMELVQRPGDILRLTWDAYHEDDGYVFIRQSKRGVEVRVPPTERLKCALHRAKSKARAASTAFAHQYICPTKTGKHRHRRNFAKAVRLIARQAGIPDELQVRDLRRTGATEGASAGATPWEMMATGGWQNQASIQPYLIWTTEQAAAFQAKREAYRLRLQQPKR